MKSEITIKPPYDKEYEAGYSITSIDGLDRVSVHLRKIGATRFLPVTTYSRYLMETHLGRFLEPNEKVFHEDKNKLNFDINNLRIKVINDKTIIDKPKYVRAEAQKVELTCDCCGSKFIRLKRLLAASATHRFCNNACQHRYYRTTKLRAKIINGV